MCFLLLNIQQLTYFCYFLDRNKMLYVLVSIDSVRYYRTFFCSDLCQGHVPRFCRKGKETVY